MSYTLKVKKPVANCLINIQPRDFETASNVVWDMDVASITLSQPGAVEVSIYADGYEEFGQSVNVDKDIFLSPQLNKYVSLTIKPNPSDAKVVIEYGGKKYEQKTLEKIIANTTVSYVVSKINKETVSDSIVLNNDLSIDVELIDKITSDAGIGNYEGKGTDEIAQIKLLSEEEVNNLSPEKKARYVRYDPTLSNSTGVNYTKAMTDALTQLYFMSPIASKISTFTNGTMDEANFYFMSIIKQLEPIAEAGRSVNSKIRSIRKAASKVGLGPLIDILTTILQLIGCVAALMSASTCNPNNMLGQYIQAFKDIDFKELLRKTVGQTIPQLQYAIDALEGKPAPDVDVKELIKEQVQEMLDMAGITQECVEMIMQIEDLFMMYKDFEEDVKNLLTVLIIVSSGGSMGNIAELLERLMIDYNLIKNNLGKNKFFKNIENSKSCLDKTLTMDKKYIDKQDLEYLNDINKKSMINEDDYKSGYNDALENSKNGETEEEMLARIAKYIAELEKLGKDYKSYVNGYKFGWNIGSIIYKNNIMGLKTKEQQDSYHNGYLNGYNYGSRINDLAKNYIGLGKLSYILDVDNHIHNYNYEPIGRIGDDNKIYSFPDEIIIGEYYPKTHEIKLNEKKYILQDGLIFDISVTIETTSENINQMINDVHKYMLIMIERSDPDSGNINPYYAQGWEDGFNDRDEENILIDDTITQNKNGVSQGYEYAKQGKDIDYINQIIINSDNSFYNQGIATGYNNYQGEYNSGYNIGWTNSLTKEEYKDIYDITDAQVKSKMIKQKKDFFEENYGTKDSDWNNNGEYVGNKTDANFIGTLDGWDDVYNNVSEPKYHDIYIKNY